MPLNFGTVKNVLIKVCVDVRWVWCRGPMHVLTASPLSTHPHVHVLLDYHTACLPESIRTHGTVTTYARPDVTAYNCIMDLMNIAGIWGGAEVSSQKVSCKQLRHGL